MKTIQAKTLKGFRDFLPSEARKRQYVIDTLKGVFELYGFEPLETPALEYAEILEGKYGEEGDKLMYKFEDRGGRKVALRYDQTVPLARVVAQYGSAGSPQVLPMPFKRYQIQPVWRAENPQKGRFREFLQCDLDIVGSNSIYADLEILMITYKSLTSLGFKDFRILINDRNLFSSILKSVGVEEKDFMSIIRSIDKLKKIGKKSVIKELVEKGFDEAKALLITSSVENSNRTAYLDALFCNLDESREIDNTKFEFESTLARGLDYYTSLIFEIEIPAYEGGSLGGGGRYDDLIGMFTEKNIPAVGLAFGFDRIIEVMTRLNLFPANLAVTKVLVTVFYPNLLEKSMEIASLLRSNNINTEIYIEETISLDKQLKYANQKNIPYVIIIGPNEVEKGTVTIKNLTTRDQIEVRQEELNSFSF